MDRTGEVCGLLILKHPDWGDHCVDSYYGPREPVRVLGEIRNDHYDVVLYTAGSPGTGYLVHVQAGAIWDKGRKRLVGSAEYRLRNSNNWIRRQPSWRFGWKNLAVSGVDGFVGSKKFLFGFPPVTDLLDDLAALDGQRPKLERFRSFWDAFPRPNKSEDRDIYHEIHIRLDLGLVHYVNSDWSSVDCDAASEDFDTVFRTAASTEPGSIYEPKTVILELILEELCAI